jgi:hypothetical protein
MADEIELKNYIKEAFKLTPDQQYNLAQLISNNVGYVLVREDSPMLQAPKGCICPPTSELTCKSLFCGRGAGTTFTTMT